MLGLAAVLVIFGLRGLVYALWVFGVVGVQACVALWAAGRIRDFEARFHALVEKRDIAGLEELFKNAGVVRFFAARGWFWSREGLFYALAGRLEEAEKTLELAWLSTQQESRFSLLPLMCRTKYRLGRMDDVAVLAEDWVRLEPEGPGVWYAMLCELRHQGSSTDTEVALRLHHAPEVRDATDREVRDHVLSFR